MLNHDTRFFTNIKISNLIRYFYGKGFNLIKLNVAFEKNCVDQQLSQSKEYFFCHKPARKINSFYK